MTDPQQSVLTAVIQSLLIAEEQHFYRYNNNTTIHNLNFFKQNLTEFNREKNKGIANEKYYPLVISVLVDK